MATEEPSRRVHKKILSLVPSSHNNISNQLSLTPLMRLNHKFGHSKLEEPMNGKQKEQINRILQSSEFQPTAISAMPLGQESQLESNFGLHNCA